MTLLKTSRRAIALRYELHDPFADATYRSDRFEEISQKADQLGAMRLSAIDAQGNRTPITKVSGQWKLGQKVVQSRASREVRPPEEAPSSSPPKVASPSHAPERSPEQPTSPMHLEAENAAWRARIEASLAERYVIKRPSTSVGDISLGHTEYRFRGDVSRIAFTESTLRLATDTNSPSVARSMVDLAEARNWHALKVSGSDDFRRTVWLEAAARGVKAIGYAPLPTDLEALKKARDSRLVNRVEPANGEAPSAVTAKASGRGGSGRKAVLEAIEAILVAKGVSAEKRQLVLSAAEIQLAERVRKGQVHAVMVHDAAMPQRNPGPSRQPTRERTAERPAPAR